MLRGPRCCGRWGSWGTGSFHCQDGRFLGWKNQLEGLQGDALQNYMSWKCLKILSVLFKHRYIADMQFCHITANCWIRVLGKIHFSTAMSHAKCSWHPHLQPCDSSIPFHFLRPIKLGPFISPKNHLPPTATEKQSSHWPMVAPVNTGEMPFADVAKKISTKVVSPNLHWPFSGRHGRWSQVLVDVNLQWKILLGELLLFLLRAEGNWKIQ